jgi:hypothetical protein
MRLGAGPFANNNRTAKALGLTIPPLSIPLPETCRSH